MANAGRSCLITFKRRSHTEVTSLGKGLMQLSPKTLTKDALEFVGLLIEFTYDVIERQRADG